MKVIVLSFFREKNDTQVSLTSNFVNNSHQGSFFMSSRFLTSLCVTGIDFFQHFLVEVNSAFVHFLEPGKASVNIYLVKNS